MTAVELIARYILDHLGEQRPLFVALQGPQGSGKSYVSAHLQAHLQSAPHALRVAVLSIDDIYLPHETLISLAAADPHNPLWQGRGQPGTHDVKLGTDVLSALKSGNSSIELPRFDKSLFAGRGDRLPMDGSGVIITQPPRLDVVIFEGWCVGFQPITEDELAERWNGIWKSEREKLGLGENQMGRKADIQAINDALRDYLRLWDFFDIFVQPVPPSSPELSQYAVVYKWRLEQEHHMKALNGGRGMSDEAVKSFVDRYIPGYVFFGNIACSRKQAADIENDSSMKYSPKRLIVTLDEERRVVGTTLL
ncbi:P-loop containing nucleoside triphosphate hydrolase protein [Agrocybe pediades]|nr:P-loop containing nucleoside triphosphate hydrolase protein [Agrocybe pediades]